MAKKQKAPTVAGATLPTEIPQSGPEHTDRKRLSQAASLLLGERWQCALARRLRVDERLVRRWVAGSRPIPPWVWPRLAAEAQAQLAAMRAVFGELP